MVQVSNEAELRDAIFNFSNAFTLGNPPPFDTIELIGDIILTQSLPMIRADDGLMALTIIGNGHTIDAADMGRVFFVETGRVEIRDVTIENARAAGGGGGLGAGAAVFVNDSADVRLTGVTIGDAVAVGGDGGDSGDDHGGGGGGGLGGDGGDGSGGGGGYEGGGGNGMGAAGGGGGGEFGDGVSATSSNGGGGGGGQLEDGEPNDGSIGGDGGGNTGGEGGATGAAGSEGGALGGGGGGGGAGADDGGRGGDGGISGGGGGGGNNGIDSAGDGGVGDLGGGGGGGFFIGGGGGDFGGGGGGGGNFFIDDVGGGAGGFGGGGGGGYNGGVGGFGAGGGGAYSGGVGGAFGGDGGNGADDGPVNEFLIGGGGGGAALGGAVFVRDGGRLTLDGTVAFSGSYDIAGGAGGVSGGGDAEPGENGGAHGERFFLHGDSAVAFQVRAGEIKEIDFIDEIAGLGGIEKTGDGTLIIGGILPGQYSGSTTVADGVLQLDGALGRFAGADGTSVSATTVMLDATLAGIGVAGAVTIKDGGTLAPGSSPGILETGALVLETGATLEIEIGGLTEGTYDRIEVTGNVSLNGANLDLAIIGGFLPATTDGEYLIIANDDADAVTGTFDGHAEGATFDGANGSKWTISYAGGSGNDVVLTVVEPPDPPVDPGPGPDPDPDPGGPGPDEGQDPEPGNCGSDGLGNFFDPSFPCTIEGDGDDRIVLAGDYDDYVIVPAEGGFEMTEAGKPDAVLFFSGIETLQFADLMLTREDGADARFLYGLYETAFDRPAEPLGLAFWIGAFGALPPHGIALAFVLSDEFAALYGQDPTDAELLTALYENTFDRAPDQAGFDYWLDALQDGLGEAALVTGFAASQELADRLGNATDDGIFVAA